MPKHNQQHKIVDMPLFRPPDHHRTIWKSLQLMKLMSKMLMEYQNLQEGDHDE